MRLAAGPARGAYSLPQRLPSCSEGPTSTGRGPTSIRGSEQRREGTGREGKVFPAQSQVE